MSSAGAVAPQRNASLPTARIIAEHAHDLFAQRGYGGTSIRDIAGAAGVDPSLVMRHFNSKAELFSRVIGFDEHFAPRLDGDLGTVGPRLVDYLLAPEHESMRRTFTALLRASDVDRVREDLQRIMRRLLVERLRDRLDGDDAELRAELVSAQLVGLIHAHDHLVLGEDSATRTRIVALYGSAVQRLITPAR